jgi:hypothetical protein
MCLSYISIDKTARSTKKDCYQTLNTTMADDTKDNEGRYPSGYKDVEEIVNNMRARIKEIDAQIDQAQKVGPSLSPYPPGGGPPRDGYTAAQQNIKIWSRQKEELKDLATREIEFRTNGLKEQDKEVRMKAVLDLDPANDRPPTKETQKEAKDLDQAQDGFADLLDPENQKKPTYTIVDQSEKDTEPIGTRPAPEMRVSARFSQSLNFSQERDTPRTPDPEKEQQPIKEPSGTDMRLSDWLEQSLTFSQPQNQPAQTQPELPAPDKEPER